MIRSFVSKLATKAARFFTHVFALLASVAFSVLVFMETATDEKGVPQDDGILWSPLTFVACLLVYVPFIAPYVQEITVLDEWVRRGRRKEPLTRIERQHRIKLVAGFLATIVAAPFTVFLASLADSAAVAIDGALHIGMGAFCLAQCAYWLLFVPRISRHHALRKLYVDDGLPDEEEPVTAPSAPEQRTMVGPGWVAYGSPHTTQRPDRQDFAERQAIGDDFHNWCK